MPTCKPSHPNQTRKPSTCKFLLHQVEFIKVKLQGNQPLIPIAKAIFLLQQASPMQVSQETLSKLPQWMEYLSLLENGKLRWDI